MKIEGTEIEFTRFWKEKDKKKIVNKLKEILPEMPNFDYIKIGLTSTCKGVSLKDHKFSNPEGENYIRLKKDASHHTIIHELTHLIFDEEFIDLFALSFDVFETEPNTSYLELPKKLPKKNLQKIAKFSLNKFFVDNINPIEYFYMVVSKQIQENRTKTYNKEW